MGDRPWRTGNARDRQATRFSGQNLYTQIAGNIYHVRIRFYRMVEEMLDETKKPGKVKTMKDFTEEEIKIIKEKYLR